MKAKRSLFFIFGAGLLIYGVAQILVTTWQIYSSNFDTELMTHPKILIMGGVHFIAAFLGMMSISWSWKFAAAGSVDSGTTAEPPEEDLLPDDDDAHSSEPAPADEI